MSPAWPVYATVMTIAAVVLYFNNRRQIQEMELLNAESDRLLKVIEAWAPYVDEYAAQLEDRARQAVTN